MKRGSAIRSQVLLLGSFVGRTVLGLVTTVMLGRMLAPDAFGFFAFVNTLFFLGQEVMNLGLVPISVREIVRAPEKERALLEGLMAWRRWCGFGLGLVVLGMMFFESDPSHRSVLVGAAIGMMLLSPWALYGVFQVRQAQESPALIGIFGPVFVIAGSLAFEALKVAEPLYGWLVVLREVIAAWLIKVFAVRLLGYTPRPGLRMEGLRPLLRTAAIYGGAVLCHSLYMYIDVFIVRYFRGETELGAYAAAFRPMTALMALPGLLMVPLLPIFTAAAKSDRSRFDAQVEGLTALFIGFGALSAVAGAMLSRDAIEILYGGQYLAGELDAVAALRWLCIAFGVMFAASACPTSMLAEGREKTLLFLVILGLAANSIGNLICVPIYGFNAAAVITAATEGLFAIGALTAASKSAHRFPVRFAHAWVLIPAALLALALSFLEMSPLPRVLVGTALGVAAAISLLQAPGGKRVRAELQESQSLPGIDAPPESTGPVA